MVRFGRVARFGLLFVLAAVVVLGTFWPTGLNWLLPDRLHYESWPFWLKAAGWAIVVFVAAADFVRGLQDAGDDRPADGAP